MRDTANLRSELDGANAANVSRLATRF
jgi:hypothetical protein